jgi:hypothetical protein
MSKTSGAESVASIAGVSFRMERAVKIFFFAILAAQ